MSSGSRATRLHGHRTGIVATEILDHIGSKDGARDSITNAHPSRKRTAGPGPALSRRLVSLAEASEYLAVSDWSVRAMVWRGDLPHVRRGKRILLDLKDLDSWIDREKVRGA
jgi:excisionase family DNA binding protein